MKGVLALWMVQLKFITFFNTVAVNLIANRQTFSCEMVAYLLESDDER
jgi:hypothetical protein